MEYIRSAGLESARLKQHIVNILSIPKWTTTSLKEFAANAAESGYIRTAQLLINSYFHYNVKYSSDRRPSALNALKIQKNEALVLAFDFSLRSVSNIAINSVLSTMLKFTNSHLRTSSKCK